MRVSRRDTLLAFKAIGLAEGLKETERRVACALLDHFNRDTWRCDPSLDTIATLLGMSRRTVIRSIGVLVQQRYFRKVRHGGRFHKNSYEPIWETFRSIEARWKSVRERHRARFSAPNLSPSERRARHSAGDAGGTQTCSINLFNGTCEDGAAGKPCGPVRRPEKTPQRAQKSDERHVRPAEAARSAVQWRWDKDLMERCKGRPDIYARIVDVIDQAMADSATAAEFERPGGGLDYLRKEFDQKGLSEITSALTDPGDAS